MENSKHKLLFKVWEERELDPVEMIYLNIHSQKKTSYVGYNNWILLQDSDTKQNGISSQIDRNNWLRFYRFPE